MSSVIGMIIGTDFEIYSENVCSESRMQLQSKY